MSPRHINPTDPQRKASAPYNFVPLPNSIFTVEDGIEVLGQQVKPWQAHDSFIPGTHSGWLNLTITTVTPLYIRAPVTLRKDRTWDTRDSRLRPSSYCRPDGRLAIPGSSLRGMMRALVEILSFGKIQPVSRAKPFFRTVAPDRIGELYRQRILAGEGPRGGLICKEGDDWAIEPCDVLRVPKVLLPKSTHNGNLPVWDHQHRKCWLQDNDGLVSMIVFEERSGTGWRRGILVLTGLVPNKRKEFVFVQRIGGTDKLLIPQNIWQRFHDDDQITQWQEQAFPWNKPKPQSRRAAGHLGVGEPVFFVADLSRKSSNNPDGLVFLGRAGMFRLPYDVSPEDLVPAHLRTGSLDLAEAMFGRVGESTAIKGRVFFEDAVAVSEPSTCLEPVIVPRILSSPKVTTFQHYLTQDGTKPARELTTFIDGDHTAIRGHKLFWSRWDKAQGLNAVKVEIRHDEIATELQQPDPHDTQHTIIQPVKAGIIFRGRVRFENLTDIELGALLEAASLPPRCHHRIGMGKPLGLGTIKIDAQLNLIDRALRYGSWQASGVRHSQDGHAFRQAFHNTILRHAENTDETLIENRPGLRRIARLDALYLMLEWDSDSRPAFPSTSYMELPRFRQRPVLPTPHSVAGASEPSWAHDPPHPAGANATTSARRVASTTGREDTKSRQGRPTTTISPREPSPTVPAPTANPYLPSTKRGEKRPPTGGRPNPTGRRGPKR
jgi:CRISPR-associated protein (TIGR03986 family)